MTRFGLQAQLMSAFDPEAFLKGTAVDGAMSTEFVNVPENEYTAVSTEIKVKQQKIEGEDRLVAELQWQVDDPQVAEFTGRNKNFVKQSIFLDVTPQGSLDLGRGKNVNLALTREALGQNNPGERWTFDQLIGKTARVLVTHKLNSGDGKIYAGVKSVRPL